jgi:hypothetical protein
MHDFGRVLRQSLPAVLMLLGDQRKYVLEFSQGRLARVHQRVAASESRDFGYPRTVVLAVEDDLVIVKTHDQLYGARQECQRKFQLSGGHGRLLVPVNAD